MLFQCDGWECSRLISVSEIPGGNPAAREDPESFAMEASTCADCGGLYCDRCAVATASYLRRSACPVCLGPLASWGQRREGVSQKPEAVRHYRRGVELGKARRFADSLAELDRAVQLRPGFPVAQFYRGIALRELGRYDEALVAMERAHELYPGEVQALFDKGGIYRRLGRLPEALDVYRRALRIRPAYFAVLVNLGLTLNELGRYEEALATLDEAVGLLDDPRVVGVPDHGIFYAHGTRGAALTNLGRYGEALAAIDIALSTGPDHPLVHRNRGLVLERLRRVDDARAAYRLADELEQRR